MIAEKIINKRNKILYELNDRCNNKKYKIASVYNLTKIKENCMFFENCCGLDIYLSEKSYNDTKLDASYFLGENDKKIIIINERNLEDEHVKIALDHELTHEYDYDRIPNFNKLFDKNYNIANEYYNCTAEIHSHTISYLTNNVDIKTTDFYRCLKKKNKRKVLKKIYKHEHTKS
jgi:hypothetical protein